MSCADGISAITDDAKDLSELVATADLNAEREKALRYHLHDESVECGEGVQNDSQNAGDVKDGTKTRQRGSLRALINMRRPKPGVCLRLNIAIWAVVHPLLVIPCIPPFPICNNPSIYHIIVLT